MKGRRNVAPPNVHRDTCLMTFASYNGAFSPPGSVPSVANGWHETLTASSVRISGAHPFLDPGGYRAHMIFELAQRHLNIPGLYNALLQRYQVTPADPAGPAPALGKDFNFQFTYEHTAVAAATRDPQYPLRDPAV